jgi:hypothetical protein
MQKEKAENDEIAKLFKNNKEFSFSERSIFNFENGNNINHDSFMEYIKKNGYDNMHYSEESTESTNKLNR